MPLLRLAQNCIADLKKKTANEWAGPCPECGGTDRFLVWTHRQAWHCRSHGESGDAVAFLRRFQGVKCPDAHEQLGKSCDSSTCPAREKCRLGDGRRVAQAPRPLAPPAERRDDWSPSEAVEPAELWRQKAGAFVGWAHQQLLESPEQLAYLAGRGIPRGAVDLYRLGWNPGEKGKNAIFRDRAAWGLPEKVVEGKRKRLWIPRGIVIPAFRGGELQKVRIRRPKEDRDQITLGYYALEGGGDEVPVYGESERAFVVTEADLCGVAVAWACRGIAGAVPLASCSVKPKTWAASVLDRALCILVATDFDPGTDERTGKYKNPGGKAARWWKEHYPRAERWPVPSGKDPGDYATSGGCLRAWAEAGLRKFAPVLTLGGKDEARGTQDAEFESEPAPCEEEAASPLTPHASPDVPVHMVSGGGRPFVLVHTRGQHRAMLEEHPGTAVVGSGELQRIDPVCAEEVLMVKALFPGAEVLETRPYAGDPRESKVVKFDPSRQRVGRG